MLNANSLVELTMQLVANVTELAENHPVLLTRSDNLLDQIVKIAQQLLTFVEEQGTDYIDMMDLSFGNLQLGKSVCLILHNLCCVTDKTISGRQAQMICMEAGFGILMTQMVK